MSKLRLTIGSIAIAALVLSACGGDDKKSDATSDVLATDEMVVALRATIGLAAATPDRSVDLNACPFGDFDGLVAKAPLPVEAVVDPDEQLVAYVYQTEGQGERPHLQCGRGDVGVYTGEVPPDDYRDDLVALLDDFVVTFDDDSAHRGGTLVRFCAQPIGVGSGGFCEADWYDDNVWVGVFTLGDALSSELSEQWLVAILDDVVANVVQLAPTMTIVD